MKTISIDFDGVIHKYSDGWKDGSIYDKAFENAFSTINHWLSRGYTIFILSTRRPRQIKKWLKEKSNPLLYMSKADFYDQYMPMQDRDADYINREYANKNQLQYKVKIIPFWKKFWNETGVIGITKRKLPAHIYLDDRALKFDGDWEKLKNITVDK